jgi:integrase/recombinase XerD
MTFDQAQAIYVEDVKLRGLVQGTADLAVTLFKRFERFLVLRDIRDLREVRTADLIDYAVWLRTQKGRHGRELNQNYRNDHTRIVVRLFALLYERRRILTDITRKLPTTHDIKPLPRGVMDEHEAMELLRQPNLSTPTGFRDRAILELLYSSGLRARELCELSVYDLDLTDAILRVTGKGGKDRFVPIGKVAAGYLAEYLEKIRPLLCERRKPTARAAAPDLVFITAIGTPVSTNYLYTLVVKYRRRAGLPEDITPHSLRHTCATEMLKGGAGVRHVQELLGHSQITTTQIYTRLVPVDLKKVHAKTAPSERGKVPDVSFDPDKPRFIPKRKRRR